MFDWDSNLVKVIGRDMVKVHIPDPLGRRMSWLIAPNVSVYCIDDYDDLITMYDVAKHHLHHQGRLIWGDRWDDIKLLSFGATAPAAFKKITGISYSLSTSYGNNGSIRSTLTVCGQVMNDGLNFKKRYSFGIRSTIGLKEAHELIDKWFAEKKAEGVLLPKGYAPGKYLAKIKGK